MATGFSLGRSSDRQWRSATGKEMAGSPLCSTWAVMADGVRLAVCGSLPRSSVTSRVVSDGASASVPLATAAVKLGGPCSVLRSAQQRRQWRGVSMIELLVFFMMWMNLRVSGQCIYRGEAMGRPWSQFPTIRKNWSLL
jgi:hypothetical protein